MNLKYSFFTLIISFVLSSCGDIQPPEPVDLSGAKSVVGNWELQEIEVLIGEKGIKVTDKGLEDNFYKNSTYEFRAAGTFKFVYSDGDNYEGEYTFDTNTNSLVLIEPGEDGEGDYSFNYTTEFTNDGLEIISKPINMSETELFSDDGYFLFEAISLLEDQESNLENFETFEGQLLSIKYKYKKKA